MPLGVSPDMGMSLVSRPTLSENATFFLIFLPEDVVLETEVALPFLYGSVCGACQLVLYQREWVHGNTLLTVCLARRCRAGYRAGDRRCLARLIVRLCWWAGQLDSSPVRASS